MGLKNNFFRQGIKIGNLMGKIDFNPYANLEDEQRGGGHNNLKVRDQILMIFLLATINS